MIRKRNWLIGIAIATILGIVAPSVIASVLARRFEPYIREQAIEYLRKRFDSDVELAALRVHIPQTSPFRLLLRKGRGALAHVEGDGISLRHKGRWDVPPMIAVKKFRFDVDLGALFDKRRTVQSVLLEGMEISIPPKDERPELSAGSSPETSGSQAWVLITDVTIQDARLLILPKDKKKTPLEFFIHDLRLNSAGMGLAMRYNAVLTNPRPPGAIHALGSFGPWNAEEPGDTPLSGDYSFEKANLGVFAGIAGILDSTGHFDGTLNSIHAKGQASVPDFRLKIAGNPVPLVTQFEALIDGTKGNVILQPAIAMLGTTQFSTGGVVIKNEGDLQRTISLDVSMPQGDLADVLLLAMKGKPFMEGQIFLKTKIEIPPFMGKVREKLRLDGIFEMQHGRFLHRATQDKIDTLSRRGQGKPRSEDIDEVVSGMKGKFNLENEVIRFTSLSFTVPGARIALKGNYDLQSDALDFHGTMKLQATVSQTMTGWKRWALKPLDPFFAKEGAGTFLRIKVTGTSKETKFGRDRSNKGS